MITGAVKDNGRSHIRTPYQLMLIVAVILTAYYPVAFSAYSRVDDHDIVTSVSAIRSWDLRTFFLPHIQHGGYYRPVVFLSFYADKCLFNLDAGFMHLHNIILHTINALLIFWLARQITPARKQGESLIPLVSALVFGLHPIATEPVSWIAGRTDVLACTFILLSANCIIRFKKTGFYQYIVLSALFMTFGFLTKEVALAFLPGAYLLMVSPLYPADETVREQGALSQDSLNRYTNLLIFLLGFVALLLFFLLRHFAFESGSGRIAATIRLIRSDVVSGGIIVLQALGFYVKKIFFPFPLSFAITVLDPLYELIGVPILVLCFFIMTKRSMVSALFLTGICLIVPSFTIAFGQIAWTSFAERYIYLPTAFITVASVFLVAGYVEKTPSLPRYREAFIISLLAIMAVATFYRSTLWKDSLSFLKDTVAKNPDFCTIRAQYADELAIRGDITNSRIQYTIANEYNKTKKRLKNGGDLYQLQYWDMPELGLADLLNREHKISEAIEAYENIIRDANGDSTATIQALNNVIILYDGLLNDAKSRFSSERIERKIALYSEMLYKKKSDDADIFYLLGKKFLMRGEKQEALAYFRMAENKFSPDNKYKAISHKFIARLEGK